MTVVSTESSIRHALDKVTKGAYLGDHVVVDGLLRNFAFQLLTQTGKLDEPSFMKALDSESKSLANIFLGQDERYPGPDWNTVGQIDVYVSRRVGIVSEDPQERVAGALISMIGELMELSQAIHDGKQIKEQWQWQANAVIDRYVRILMGLPPGGLDTVPAE